MLAHKKIKKLLELFNKKHYEKAENLACSLTKEFPEQPTPWTVLGAIYMQTSRPEEALTVFQKSASLTPSDPHVWNNLGAGMKALSRFDQAEKFFRKALELNPKFSGAINNLAITKKTLGEFGDAEALYRKAIKITPNSAVNYNNLGILLNELNRFKESEKYFKRAVELNPAYFQAWNNLGTSLNKLGSLKEAKTSFDRAIELSPGYTTALNNRSKLLFDQMEFRLAIKDAEACNSEEAKERILAALYALGDIVEIQKRLKAYSETDVTSLRVAAFSSFMSARQGADFEYKFCNHPLSFIHVTQLSSNVENPNNFIKNIINELGEVKTVWETSDKATKKGFQTLSSINLFSDPSDNLRKLENIIRIELDAYHQKFENETCTLIKNWPSSYKLHGWHVILKQQGYQEPHIHPSGWLSGVIYLQVVPSLGKNEGAIEFTLNSLNYSDKRSPNQIYQPSVGDIVLFPSSLHHRTIPFTTDSDRIIIAFDLLPDEVVKDG